MAIGFSKYSKVSTIVRSGTPGGDTHVIDGRPLCFALVRSHVRATQALAGELAVPYTDISDAVVDERLDAGEIIIDESDCLDTHGWLGCKVYDPEEVWIGTIGDRCSQLAGQATDHPGTGRCRLHGGNHIYRRSEARMTHGRTAKLLHSAIEHKIQAYMDDPTPTDLTKELAIVRALLDQRMEMILGKGDPQLLLDSIPGLAQDVERVSRIVDRITKVEQRYALTAGQVMYIQQLMVDVINIYIEDPDIRKEAAGYVVRKLGGTQAALIGAG